MYNRYRRRNPRTINCQKCGVGVDASRSDCWRCGLEFPRSSGDPVYGRRAKYGIGVASRRSFLRNPCCESCGDGGPCEGACGPKRRFFRNPDEPMAETVDTVIDEEEELPELIEESAELAPSARRRYNPWQGGRRNASRYKRSHRGGLTSLRRRRRNPFTSARPHGLRRRRRNPMNVGSVRRSLRGFDDEASVVSWCPPKTAGGGYGVGSVGGGETNREVVMFPELPLKSTWPRRRRRNPRNYGSRNLSRGGFGRKSFGRARPRGRSRFGRKSFGSFSRNPDDFFSSKNMRAEWQKLMDQGVPPTYAIPRMQEKFGMKWSGIKRKLGKKFGPLPFSRNPNRRSHYRRNS
jgi:hypothetical protein